ncbi:hypothetical protein R6Q57_027146 [Mikania cordata]
MGSCSLYLKLVSCRNKNLGFLCFKDDHLLGNSPLKSTLHRNKSLDFNFSISVSSSHRVVRPVYISSSHTQAEDDNHKFLIEESPSGYTSTQVKDVNLSVEAETQTVGVQFQLQRECSFGQNFLITGDHPILGLWDPKNAISLTWSDGHVWTVDIDIPVGKCIKFKFIMQESDGKFVWQPGPDRILQTKKNITLCEDWENPDSRIIIETDPIMNQFVEPSFGTQEPEEYVKEVLVSDEGVPVLVPGLSQLMVNDEPETVNDASMVSTGPDMDKDLALPELNLKGDIANTSNLNPRPEISSIHENQESRKNKHQEAEEQDHQATQLMGSLLHNDIQWSNKVMQKFLNIFGIQ